MTDLNARCLSPVVALLAHTVLARSTTNREPCASLWRQPDCTPRR